MLSHGRPHDDPFTDYFAGRYILRPLWMAGIKPHVDVQKNIVFKIGESETLFSCHYDTCHRKGGFQHLEFDEKEGLIWKNDGECLGADDGGGVWVLLQLALAKKPGLYIFHNGEERGCVGSRFIAEKREDLLKPMKRAIAFDRRGVHSIITEMSPGKTCSDTFALELAKRLKMKHSPDPTGTMTDTGRYIKLIPEVTNVSVGYANEHGPRETLDADYLFELCERLVDVDFETLPVVRDPDKYVYTGRGGHYSGGYQQPVPTGPNHYLANRPGYVQDKDGVWRYVGATVAPIPTPEPKKESVQQTMKEWLMEEFGTDKLPDPAEEPADFVQIAMDVLGAPTDDKEYAFMENALHAYCALDPKSALKDLLDILEQ